MKILKKLKNKRGFTLIELLTVIAILGILVLIAAPKFLGYTAKANVAHIKADVKTYETRLAVDELENKNLSKDWTIVAPEDVDKYISEKSLYDEYGLVKDPTKIEGEVKLLDKKDVDVKTNLKGDFLYANGEVYYHGSPSNANVGGTTEEPEEPTQPEDPVVTNFTWIEDTRGYTLASQPNKGYYKYTGTEETVVIPESIEGDELTSYYKMFTGVGETVKKVVSTNKNIISTRSMFAFSKMSELDLSEFDTSNVTNMLSMFAGLKIIGSGKTLDLSAFDTSNVTNMASMFSSAQIPNIDVSKWDTSNVTNMASMFQDAQIPNIDVSKWDTSNVTNMSYMFQDAQIPNIDVSKWDTSNVTNMASMFAEVKTDKIDLSNWNTPNVTKMNAYYSNYILQGSSGSGSGFFEGSKAGEIIIGPNFNTSKLTSLSRMFANVNMNNVKGLEHIKDTNATQAIDMFRGATGATLDISHLKFDKVIPQDYNTDEAIKDGLGDIFGGSKFDLIYVSNQSIIDRVNNEITLKGIANRPVMGIK